jgi:hypothetical protein
LCQREFNIFPASLLGEHRTNDHLVSLAWPPFLESSSVRDDSEDTLYLR